MMKNFKCKRCGECCRSPRLNKADIKRIKKAGHKEKDFVESFSVGNYIKEKNGWCMFLKCQKSSRRRFLSMLKNQRFLTRGKKVFCKIYKARPRICRLYPSELIDGSCKPEKLNSDRLFE